MQTIEARYNALCDACDRVLMAMRHSHFAMAIPWLHVIRAHPHFLRDYEETLTPVRAFRRWPRLLIRFSSYLARMVGGLVRSLRTQGFGINGDMDLSGRVDVVIVSHLVNTSHLKEPRDFYFDCLPASLIAQGHTVVVALIDHTGNRYLQEWSPRRQDGWPARLVLGRSMSFLQESRWLFGCLKVSLQLFKFGVTPEGRRLPRGIRSRAIVEAWSGGSRAAMRIAGQVGHLAAKLQPKLVLTTKEGHSWEACAFAQVRSASPDTYCLAYQHAPLFRHQHAIMRPLGANYDPHGVLCAGAAAAKRFRELNTDRRFYVGVLGSPRAGNGAGDVFMEGRVRRTGKPQCLVLFEGLLEETLIIWRFVQEAARQLPDVQFNCRLHPALDFEVLKHHAGGEAPSSGNIRMSSGSLDDDARDATWALYRGTSAIVFALSYGAIPIYLSQAGELTIDPLHDLGPERPIVSSIEEFAAIVGGRGIFPRDQLERIAQHCKDLYSPLRPQAINEFFATTGVGANE